MKAAKMVFREVLVFRRTWVQSLFFSFLQPTMFLGAMGLGLGALVNRGGNDLGVPYVHFLAPGMLAATCMNTATFSSTFPILSKIVWQQNYEAILATPLGVIDVLAGEVAWAALRLSMVACAFLVVMFAFGAASSPLALLAFPAAVLTGLAFATPIIAFTAWFAKISPFNWLFRFIITPMFLFSGTFFPVERLPAYLRPIAYATPLYHGVALTRGFVIGKVEPMAALAHSTILVAILIVSFVLAYRALSRRLVT